MHIRHTATPTFTAQKSDPKTTREWSGVAIAAALAMMHHPWVRPYTALNPAPKASEQPLLISGGDCYGKNPKGQEMAFLSRDGAKNCLSWNPNTHILSVDTKNETADTLKRHSPASADVIVREGPHLKGGISLLDAETRLTLDNAKQQLLVETQKGQKQAPIHLPVPLPTKNPEVYNIQIESKTFPLSTRVEIHDGNHANPTVRTLEASRLLTNDVVVETREITPQSDRLLELNLYQPNGKPFDSDLDLILPSIKKRVF
jgi:hypothetical protein